jgi:LysR family transcriptional regulator, glycine cleavage system transcriptional activator
MRRLPPLNSLRAFESAARHLSFSKAAEELFVTPAAISQQIKQLEGFLGVVLFRRMTRAVSLTEDAKVVLPTLTEGFDKLAHAVEHLSHADETGLLTVSTPPTFAAKWLLQRLPRFSDEYPDIDVRLDASLVPREFGRDGIDVSIRLGDGEFPGLHTSRIFDEEFSPVCSPRLIDSGNPLKQPSDIKNHRLLHVDWGKLQISLPDWRMWTHAAGIANAEQEHGLHFNVESMAIEAAINGDGVALVSHHAVVDDIEAGRLVRPFELTLPADYSYWLVCPQDHLHRVKVKAFCDWMSGEVVRDVRSSA